MGGRSWPPSLPVCSSPDSAGHKEGEKCDVSRLLEFVTESYGTLVIFFMTNIPKASKRLMTKGVPESFNIFFFFCPICLVKKEGGEGIGEGKYGKASTSGHSIRPVYCDLKTTLKTLLCLCPKTAFLTNTSSSSAGPPLCMLPLMC